MRILPVLGVVVVLGSAGAAPAQAQRFPFERAFDVTGTSILDVSTVRGRIEITAGEPGRIVISGTVTVRADWNVPANAAVLAKGVAANPPIQQDGQTVRLQVPVDRDEQRAVTVSYRVRVPSNTRVTSVSESGATTVRAVSGMVVVRTRSGAIELTRLGAAVEVTTRSGAVTIDGVSGPLAVTTSSGGVVARSLAGSARVRTASGSVDAELTGEGDADVETRSSAVRIMGARGSVNASSQSGRVSVSGVPNRPWTAHSGSGGVDIAFDANASVSLEATSGSGSVRVDGATVRGSVSTRSVTGDLGAGGPLVRASSRSGAVRITVGQRSRLRESFSERSSFRSRSRCSIRQDRAGDGPADACISVAAQMVHRRAEWQRRQHPWSGH